MPSHELNLALPPQALLLLGFLPDPVLDFVLDILSPAHGLHFHMVKLTVSKLTFPVWLLSLASCLGTHCLPKLSPARTQASLFCVSSSFTAYV